MAVHNLADTRSLVFEEESSPMMGNMKARKKLARAKPLDGSRVRANEKPARQPSQPEVTIRIAPGGNIISLSINEDSRMQSNPERKGLHASSTLISAKSEKALKVNADEKGGRKPKVRKDKDGYRKTGDTKLKQTVIAVDSLGTTEITITGGKPLRSKIGRPAYVEDEDLSSRDDVKVAEQRRSRNVTSSRDHKIGRDDIHKRKAKAAGAYSGSECGATEDETPEDPPMCRLYLRARKREVLSPIDSALTLTQDSLPNKC